MLEQSLFHESLADALNDCVRALGGNKAVAVRLWPEKVPEAAHRHLLACLNEDRPERLSPEHLMLILRMAREKGCHIGATYLMRELGYADPMPIEPRDELADLIRQYRELRKTGDHAEKRIDKLLKAVA